MNERPENAATEAGWPILWIDGGREEGRVSRFFTQARFACPYRTWPAASNTK